MAKIKDLPRVDRPREKLLRYGPEKLSNSELLAILLRSGKKGENVIELATKILKKFGKASLMNASYNDLKKFSGLGPAKAAEIVACFELGKRLIIGKKSRLLMSPEDVFREMADLRNHKKEHFVVFYLDVRNQINQREIISVGSLTANLVHPREVFEPAIKNLAAQIILSHNHPSGDCEPSEEDLAITRKLVEAGKILGIEVVDHVIVSGENFLSFRKKNLIGS